MPLRCIVIAAAISLALAMLMALGTLCLIPLVFCLARPERGKAVTAH